MRILIDFVSPTRSRITRTAAPKESCRPYVVKGHMSTAPAKRLYVSASDRKPTIESRTVSVSEPEPQQRLWKISAAACKTSDAERIFFGLFGALAVLTTVPAFATLFHLFKTNALTHFVEKVLR